MSKIKAGVVGVGHIGKIHARILSELDEADFTAIYDNDLERAKEVAEQYGVRAVNSLEVFSNLVDGVSIATPTPTHYEIAKFLLERGKHCLIEKPITEDSEQAEELIALALEKKVVLQVGHIERFNPVLSALEEHLSKPKFIEAHRLSPYPNRSTEIGVVLDLMIHDLEIILHLVKSPIASIDAVGIPVLSTREDIANARIRFANGCVANITASRISAEKLRKIRVFQESAYLSLDYQAQEGYIFRLAEADATSSSLLKKLWHAKEHAIVSEFAGRKIVREPVEVDKGEPLKREVQSFLSCCVKGDQPKVTGSQATAALKLAMEITRKITAGAGEA